ncbi:hypothetical protein JQ633_31965 [Bradyrhizobium tropiciagri]|uniref:hypothetical protein n=1 Tax=Bradyrhizobium tropiciagri TaxID=312253 RepID=UPI001BA94599|nr:hypothetical protein [Bradyrhizobium tropiciagri]MBR0875013.1 hypothetical protein [Bradyrhizobium tropiciagri]
MTEAERNALIEECAIAAEAQDRTGHEWVHGSLWDNMMKRAGNNVRLLKTRPIAKPGLELAALRQAIIDNTHGDMFWIGEILLSELEKETGFNGSTPPRLAVAAKGGA